MSLKYIQGNLFEEIPAYYNPEKPIVVPHIVNNVMAWGAGFVLPLAKHFPEARANFYENVSPILGDTKYINAKNVPVIIANMYAQDDIRPINGIPPIRYDALTACMINVKNYCEIKDAVIAAPMFGCGLAAGNPDKIRSLIETIWKDLDTIIYYL